MAAGEGRMAHRPSRCRGIPYNPRDFDDVAYARELFRKKSRSDRRDQSCNVATAIRRRSAGSAFRTRAVAQQYLPKR